MNPQSERPLDARLVLADALFGDDTLDDIEHISPAVLGKQIRAGLDNLSLELVNQWLEDGKGVAVYENQDLGHPELGHRQYLTTTTFQGEVPQTLPDFPDRINCGYQLVGVYTGPAIS